MLGPELPNYTDAPLAETGARLLGDGGRLFLLAGGTISIFGYIAGDMLGTPRALLALATQRRAAAGARRACIRVTARPPWRS